MTQLLMFDLLKNFARRSSCSEDDDVKDLPGRVLLLRW